MAARFGSQANELQSRLEFPFSPVKSFELEAQRQCRCLPAETVSGDALEYAAESATHRGGKPAVGARRRVREDCPEQMIEIRLALRVQQSKGELVRLGLVQRETGVIIGEMVGGRRILPWTRGRAKTRLEGYAGHADSSDVFASK
jgi:hypothetical protein